MFILSFAFCVQLGAIPIQQTKVCQLCLWLIIIKYDQLMGTSDNSVCCVYRVSMAGGVRSRHRVKNGMKPLVRTKLSQLVNLVSDISQDMRCVCVCVCVCMCVCVGSVGV